MATRPGRDWELVGRGNNAAGTTTLAPTIHANTTTDDIMVLSFGHKGTDWAVVPAGWTLIDREIINSSRFEMYWRRATSSESAPSITGLADTAVGHIDSYRNGKLTGDPVFASAKATQAAGSSSFNTPVISSITEWHTLIVAGLFFSDNLLGSGSPNGEGYANTGTSGLRSSADPRQLLQHTQFATANGTDCAIYLSDGLKVAPGQLGQYNITINSTVDVVCIVAVFLPESSAPSTSVTRYYPTMRGMSYISRTALKGDFEGQVDLGYRDGKYGGNHPTFMLSRSKVTGGLKQDSSHRKYVASLALKARDSRWVTPPLQAQSIGGTLKLNLFCVSANSNAKYYIRVYVSVGDDLSQVRHQLFDGSASSFWNFVVAARGMGSAVSLTSGSIQEGDRIIIEKGHEFGTGGVTNNAAVHTHGTATISGIPLPDAPEGGLDVNTTSGWFEFSQVILEQATSSGLTNKTPATAQVITFPFKVEVPTIDVESSNHELWYTFTAPSNGRITLSAQNTTYRVHMRVWRGTTSNGTGIASVSDAGSFGWGFANANFDVLAGETYYVRLAAHYVSSTGFAQGAGGFLTFQAQYDPGLQIGQLFINELNVSRVDPGTGTILRLRGFGATAVGSAIDTTRLPIYDINNPGTPHTGLRVLVGIYGFELIEILDAETLNSDSFEINYLAGAFDQGATPHPVNVSAFVMGSDKTIGNVYAGYFGDGATDVIVAALGSAGSVTPTITPVTNVDEPDFTAAAATRLDADQDVGSTWFVEIDKLEQILWYTSGGREIKRISTANVQQPDFATLAAQPAGVRPGARQLRLLAPFDGSGGLIVADGDRVRQLDGSGTQVFEYFPPNGEFNLDKIHLDANGAGFWVSDQWAAALFHFNFNDAASDNYFYTGMFAGTLCGFSLYDEAIVGELPTWEGGPCVCTSPAMGGGTGQAGAAAIGSDPFIPWEHPAITFDIILNCAQGGVPTPSDDPDPPESWCQ